VKEIHPILGHQPRFTPDTAPAGNGEREKRLRSVRKNTRKSGQHGKTSQKAGRGSPWIRWLDVKGGYVGRSRKGSISCEGRRATQNYARQKRNFEET